MTVWIENPFDNLPHEGFRPQRYWLMATAFAKAGNRVVFWTSDFNHTTKRRREMSVEVDSPGVELVLVETLPYSSNVSLRRVRSHRAYAAEWKRLALTKDVPAPDVLIVSSPPLSTGEVAIALARRFGAKLVVDVMDAWPETFYRLLPHGLEWLGPAVFLPFVRAARRLYRSADLATGVCDAYGAMVRKAGAKAWHRAYHGLALPPRKPAAESESRGKPLRLVYAGNLGRTYDLATVLEAVERNPSWTLDVAGLGEQAPLLEGRERVAFHGYLGSAALFDLLCGCDIALVPMPSESMVGVPYKFGDYSAAGLAIASSLGGESAALLSRYGAGETYVHGSAASLEAAVSRLAERLCEAKDSSRRMAESEFDASRIYADYVSLVSSLA